MSSKFLDGMKGLHQHYLNLISPAKFMRAYAMFRSVILNSIGDRV